MGQKGKGTFEEWVRSLVSSSGLGSITQANMRVDFKEGEKEYVVLADLPGVRTEDIIVELDFDRVTIAVERKVERQQEYGKYIKQERSYGAVSRSFWVPGVNHDIVTAKFDNGVLTVHLPKRSKSVTRSKRIPVQ